MRRVRRRAALPPGWRWDEALPAPVLQLVGVPVSLAFVLLAARELASEQA